MEQIGRPVTRVGRDEGSDISLPALSVSRFHAEIHQAGPILELRDLGSRNGTFVNGKKVGRARIDRGDEIVFGDVRAFLVAPVEFEAHRLTEPVLRPGAPEPIEVRGRCARVAAPPGAKAVSALRSATAAQNGPPLCRGRYR